MELAEAESERLSEVILIFRQNDSGDVTRKAHNIAAFLMDKA